MTDTSVSPPVARVALVTVAIGDYAAFLRPFLESAEKHFMPEVARTFFVLSDIAPERLPKNVTLLPVPHLAWPGPTLVRYHLLLRHAPLFADYDYIFLTDVDTCFQRTVSTQLLSDLTVIHQHRLTGLERNLLPYERRQHSSAYVPWDEGGHYFSGSFLGGKVSTFLPLAKKVVDLVAADSRHHFSAVWHDESYLNRALIDAPPSVLLPESFLGPRDAPGSEQFTLVSERNHRVI